MEKLVRLKDINIGYLSLENKDTGFVEEGEYQDLGERYFPYKYERCVFTAKGQCEIKKMTLTYKPGLYVDSFNFNDFLDWAIDRNNLNGWLGYTVTRHLANHSWYKVTFIWYSDYETSSLLTNKFYEIDEKLGV